MNLLLYPSNLASPGRLLKLARSLSPLFSTTHIVGINTGGLPTKEEASPGIYLSRLPGPPLRARLGGVRIVSAWAWRVWRHYRSAAVGAVSAQNLFLLPLAHAIARRTGAIFVYNAHELETETIASRGLRQRLQRLIEKHYIYRADVVSVVNESIARWYEDTYPGIHPIVVTNAPTGDGGVINLREAAGIASDSPVYLHAGNVTNGRNIELIARTFAAQDKAHVVFVGDGSLAPLVRSYAQRCSTVHLLPPVSADQVLPLTRGADVSLCLIENDCLSHHLSTPNKMMEAFAAGTPVLCSPLPEAYRYLGDQAEEWIVVDPARDLPEAVTRIGRAQIRAFRPPRIPAWEEGAHRLCTAYEAVIASRFSPRS